MFQKEPFKKDIKMTINVKIGDETSKIDIYEHLTGEEILTYDQSRIIE